MSTVSYKRGSVESTKVVNNRLFHNSGLAAMRKLDCALKVPLLPDYPIVCSLMRRTRLASVAFSEIYIYNLTRHLPHLSQSCIDVWRELLDDVSFSRRATAS